MIKHHIIKEHSAALDDPDRFRINVMTATPNPTTNSFAIDIGIGGMTCASCVGRVERALKKVPGVQNVAVNLATESARITVTPAEHLEARLRRAVRDAGYEPRAADAGVLTEDASPWAGFAPVAIGLALSAPLDRPIFLTSARMSSGLPVKNSQPGPVLKFLA